MFLYIHCMCQKFQINRQTPSGPSLISFISFILYSHVRVPVPVYSATQTGVTCSGRVRGGPTFELDNNQQRSHRSDCSIGGKFQYKYWNIPTYLNYPQTTVCEFEIYNPTIDPIFSIAAEVIDDYVRRNPGVELPLSWVRLADFHSIFGDRLAKPWLPGYRD